MNPDPFGVLGLPVRPGLSDDDVRSAWRRVAAATHPDRADGGDPARFAAAAAAYTELRTRYGRGEAYADLAAGTRPQTHGRLRPRPRPQPIPGPHPIHDSTGSRRDSTGSGRDSGGGGRVGFTALLAVRVRRGRPGLLVLRLVIAAAVVAVAFAVTGAQPVAAGLTAGAVTWLVLTGRHDLAPPRH